MLRPCSRTKITIEHEGNGASSYNRCAWNSLSTKMNKRIRKLGNMRKSGDHSNSSYSYLNEKSPKDMGGGCCLPNSSIIKICHSGLNKRSPKDMGGAAVSQTPALLRSAIRVWMRRVPKIWGGVLSLKLQRKPSPHASVKNSEKRK